MSLGTAEEHYRKHDYSEALRASLACLQSDQAGTALLLAGKCLVAMKKFEGLSKIIGAAAQNGLPHEKTFFRIVHNCLLDGLFEPLLLLNSIIGPETSLHPIALYHASCANMMLGDEAAASEGFDRFRHGIARFLTALPIGIDDDFNVMFRQGTLVLPREATRSRVSEGKMVTAAQSHFQLIRRQPEDVLRPIVLCCADAKYVEYFGPRWLRAIAPFRCPIHIHIIDQDEASVTSIEKAAMDLDILDLLSISTSRDRFHTATSYACARFEIVPLVQQRFSCPVVALDIDIAATDALKTLISQEDFPDFGCFETGRCEPASVHQASIMMFGASPVARTFVEDLAAYCRPKLGLPVRLNWMLDQAALYSVLTLYRADQQPLRYVALDKFTGRPLPEFIVGLASDEEKHALKIKSAGLDSSASPSGIMALSWEP